MQSNVKQKCSTNAAISNGNVASPTPTGSCSVVCAQLLTICADAQITCTIIHIKHSMGYT